MSTSLSCSYVPDTTFGDTSFPTDPTFPDSGSGGYEPPTPPDDDNTPGIDPIEQCELTALGQRNNCRIANSAAAAASGALCYAAVHPLAIAACDAAVALYLLAQLDQCDLNYDTAKARCD
jgi:hypothetical protein